MSQRSDVLSYLQVCTQEGASLQKGMNFRLRGSYSVILMSVRAGSPYRDEWLEDGAVLIYEGHDIPSSDGAIPKIADQELRTPRGSLTENGKFFEAARATRDRGSEPDVVRVYEKLRKGMWVDNGFFALTDAWDERDEHRRVYKFRLQAIERRLSVAESSHLAPLSNGRAIPTAIKLQVWNRDRGRCVQCGSTDNLHFDHIVPFSLGGSSLTAENVQLLCMRHNLSKSDKII